MSSRGKAFEALLSMADEQEAAEGTAGCSSGSGVAGRCQASLQLYLALAFLSVDAPVSLERQLAARVRARGALLAQGFPSRANRMMHAVLCSRIGMRPWLGPRTGTTVVHEVRRPLGMGNT